ncbi:MAG: CHAT domain-containing protein, partial [Planctomycetota bacterium]
NLVGTLAAAGIDDQAWSESLGMIRTAERTQGAILRELLEHERHRFLGTQRGQLDLHLSLAGDLPARATQALDAVLRWKGSVARSLRRSRTDLFEQLDEDAGLALVELRTLREQLTDLFWAPEKGDRERHVARLEELRRQVQTYERELLENAAPDPAETAGTVELIEAMSANEALLVFFTHDGMIVRDGVLTSVPARLIAWVVRPTGIQRVDLGAKEDLHKVVLAYLETLRGMRGVGVEGAQQDATRHVYDHLWAPLAPHLEGVRHLVVSPDGFLNLLPFGTLADAQGRFLLERFSFSTSDDPLARLVERPVTTAVPSLVAIGGIDYDAPSDGLALAELPPGESVALQVGDASTHRTRVRDTWAPLPHTASEMRAVLALHRSAFGGDATRTGLTGQLASEAAVRDALSTASVVHLATHGFFDPAPVATTASDGRIEFLPVAPRVQEDSPGVLAGLVLAGANARESSSRGNGLLTAEELAWLDLRSADLVVLSACETALGKPWPGEGMASLRSALHSAGVRTVVSSLWAVPDQETADLMESLYRGLWTEGLPPGEALRRAQLESLARNRFAGRGPRPATWGAFVLSGAWR